MAKGKYRSAQGRVIDMNALIANNETAPAVGNMNVNARGDEILSDGTIIKTREELMKEYHNLSTMVPTDGPIPENVSHAAEIKEDEWSDWKSENDGVEEKDDIETKKESSPTGGLAAAVAATKKVTTNVKKLEDGKAKKGVSRI